MTASSACSAGTCKGSKSASERWLMLASKNVSQKKDSDRMVEVEKMELLQFAYSTYDLERTKRADFCLCTPYHT